MCVAIPMRIKVIDGSVALAETDGVTRKVRVDLLPEVTVGDYILVHAGIAITKVDEQEAMQTLSLLRGLTHEV